MQHFMVWGSAREGKSVGGGIAQAAFLSDGAIMLITQGCIDRNEMPPGFVRYLSDDERQAQGILTNADLMRLGRKWNPGVHTKAAVQVKNKPHWHRFTKTRF